MKRLVGGIERQADNRQVSDMRAELERVPSACAMGRQAAGGQAIPEESRAQEELAGEGAAVGQVMRRSPAEKREIIHLVEHSALPVERTLDGLDVPQSSFYRLIPATAAGRPEGTGAAAVKAPPDLPSPGGLG